MRRVVLALILAALLLAGCSLPFAPDTAAAEQRFSERWETMRASAIAVSDLLIVTDWDAPVWRANMEREARAWRAAVDELRETDMPSQRWAEAWPVLEQMLDEYAYVAGTLETAAKINSPTLAMAALERLYSGLNLMFEAERLLEGDE